MASSSSNFEQTYAGDRETYLYKFVLTLMFHIYRNTSFQTRGCVNLAIFNNHIVPVLVWYSLMSPPSERKNTARETSPTQREIERERHRERKREREIEREIETERERQRDRERDRERDTQREREIEREIERDRDRETER